MGKSNTAHLYGTGQVSRRNILSAALLIGIASSGAAWGQSTSGAIFGKVPAAPGETVTVQSDSGVTRQVNVDSSGRYSVNSLPLGTYTVTLQRDGKTVATKSNVTVVVNSGVEASFANGTESANAQTLATVSVSASALPPIDVSQVDSRSVVTAEQLSHLPLARTSEAIALLAPGVVAGNVNFTGPTRNGLVSFGGAGVTENAYYLNGMNVTDPLNGLGGINLPYGSLDQEEILTGGYSAAYGRSTGGVINQVGKRGTNEWHFGGQVLYSPDWGRSDYDNILFSPANSKAGQVRQYRRDNSYQETVASAYIGGPLIKDKLFLFASFEADKTNTKTVSAVGSDPTVNRSDYHDPKWYAKLDWNLNDSNILEFTGASTKDSVSGNNYVYDYDTHQGGDFSSADKSTKTSSEMWIAKYTGYITDDLTVTAQYGKQSTELYTALGAGFDPNLIGILGASEQDPLLSGGGAGITNSQLLGGPIDTAGHQVKGANYRFDVTYKLGDHTITAGIDNQRTQDLDDGQAIQTNAGFEWSYASQTGDPNAPIYPGAVGAPGGRGYYVSKYRQSSAASVRVEQRAQYIEDSWQVSDRWLVKLGLRNDQFTNFNSQNQPYIRQGKPQWAPRLGFAWDVNGDSTFKVYGNAGRYYLAMPTSVALRGASGSVLTDEFYTYTGIDPATGYPTGLVPISTAAGPGVPYSANAEYGQAPDPKTVTSTTLKSQYQDEYILGFDKQLTENWVYGVKLNYRSLKNAIDDTCNIQLFTYTAQTQGLDPSNLRGCYFFNPGRQATFQVPDGKGGYGELHYTNAELGFPHLKRDYYAATFHLDHPFDGTWSGGISYTYSRSYGNAEGQVKSDTGQSDIAATVDWDYPALMTYAGGRLSNDRKHQIKINGSYKLAEEWLLSGNINLASGAPTSCLGQFGSKQQTPSQTLPDGTVVPGGYAGNNYHWCYGAPAPAGSRGDLPWTALVALNLEYRPRFADNKLGFNLGVLNLLNKQNPTLIYPYANTNYGLVRGTQAPRYFRFGATYDF